MPKIPEVPLEIFRDLYSAAAEFAALEPWDSFNDSELFAVRETATRQTGYACVLGALGEVYALCVYRGAEGFDIHRRMQRREFDLESGEIMAAQNCLMAEFADREELEQADRETIKKLGLKFRGRRAWPRFRSHLPGFAPWHLDEAEAKFLVLALRCGTEIARKAQDEGVDLAERPGQVLCWTAAPDRQLDTAWEPEPVYERPEPRPLVLDSERVAAMRGMNLRREGAWEAGASFFPGVMMDRERPYLARNTMVADAESGFILNALVCDAETPVHQALSDAVLGAAERNGALPRELHLRGEETARLLEPLGLALGFAVRAKAQLEMVSAACDAITNEVTPAKLRQPEKRWDRRAMERATYNLSRRLQGQVFESAEEGNRYLEALRESGELDEAPAPRSALEVAQGVMYDAFEHPSPKIRVKLARRALKLSPDCADAYNLLAEETGGTLEEERALYQKGLEAGERALGPEFFEQQVGHFWGMLESRPYMRARAELARCLWQLGEHEVAIDHWREMLRLNPNDNQGMRYILLARLGELGRFEEMEDTFARYKNDCSLEFLLIKVVATFVRRGSSHESAAALREALGQNKHFPDYLLGKKRLPRRMPDSLQMGGESEAVYAVSECLPAWKKATGAMD